MKRTAMMRRPSVKRTIDRAASEAWAKGGQSKPCAVCGSEIVQGHHLIYQQTLRRIAQETGLSYERLRWDARNRLSLCERHHTAHHAGSHRVTLSVIIAQAPKFLQFVRELDRAYDEPERCPAQAFVDRTYA